MSLVGLVNDDRTTVFMAEDGERSMLTQEELLAPISWVQRGPKFINLAIEPKKPIRHLNEAVSKCKVSANSLGGKEM